MLQRNTATALHLHPVLRIQAHVFAVVTARWHRRLYLRYLRELRAEDSWLCMQ